MTIAKDKVELYAVVRGRVQGVGFRATTRHYALQLGLKGTVKNLSDGTVEMKIQGPKENIERLLQKLKHESKPAHVDKYELRYFTPEQIYEDFKIIY